MIHCYCHTYCMLCPCDHISQNHPNSSRCCRLSVTAMQCVKSSRLHACDSRYKLNDLHKNVVEMLMELFLMFSDGACAKI